MEHAPLPKSDGTYWHREEIIRAIGPDRLVERNETQTKIICTEDGRHKRAMIDHKTAENKHVFTYKCYECARDYGYQFEDQFKSFAAWLAPRELVGGRWRRHTNPFDHQGKTPELAFVHDCEGKPLFYRGGVHFLYGKPGTFKSWLALSTLIDADVRLWDFENGISGTLGRLQALGVTRERADGYTIPESVDDVQARVREYVSTKPQILCIDGFSGFADVYGLNPESNADVMKAFTEVFFPLKNAGITVIVLDHLPKDSSTDDFPIGAQAKKSQADAAFLVKNSSQNNGVELYVAKDRHGELLDRCERGTLPRRYGRLHLVNQDELLKVIITPAYEADIAGQAMTSTDVEMMQAIYDFVAGHPDCTKSDIERGVMGKTERKRTGLENLKTGGYVTARSVGTSHIHNTNQVFEPNWTPIGA